MKAKGWEGNPIDIVKMEDGFFTTVDNTRILAAREAGVNVDTYVHDFNEVISPKMAARFINKKTGALPSTWGEAVRFRIGNQSKAFSTANPSGTLTLPKVNPAKE